MTDQEPKFIHATVRHAYTNEGYEEWHIECRFDDGQKFPAVTVDLEFEELAHKIAKFLSNSP